MANLRLFIALKFSEEMTENILNLLIDMQQNFPPKHLRWVRPDNVHITLKFLGNVPLDKLNQVKETVNKTAVHSSICNAKVGGLGAYPSMDKPRTIWIGAQPDLNLLDLHKNLALKLNSYGLSKDRQAFRPHITLARVPAKLSVREVKEISATLKALNIPDFRITRFETINLIKSELTPTGPIYTILHTANLKQVA